MTEEHGPAMEETSPRRALTTVERGLDAGEVVTVTGRCEVRFDGHGDRYLGPGTRLLVLKPGGRLVLHDGTGGAAVDWRGTVHDTAVREDALVVRCRRDAPAAEVTVRFETIREATALPLDTGESLPPDADHEALRDRVLDDPEAVEPGFTPLATERPTDAGPVDVFGKDADGNAVVVELKPRRAGPGAVEQLAGYVDALRGSLHSDATVRGVLVAPALSDEGRRSLASQGLTFVALSPRD